MVNFARLGWLALMQLFQLATLVYTPRIEGYLFLNFQHIKNTLGRNKILSLQNIAEIIEILIPFQAHANYGTWSIDFEKDVVFQ